MALGARAIAPHRGASDGIAARVFAVPGFALGFQKLTCSADLRSPPLVHARRKSVQMQCSSGCAWVAARCRALPHSAHPRANPQQFQLFRAFEATLNLRVDGSIPSRLTIASLSNAGEGCPPQAAKRRRWTPPANRELRLAETSASQGVNSALQGATPRPKRRRVTGATLRAEGSDRSPESMCADRRSREGPLKEEHQWAPASVL